MKWILTDSKLPEENKCLLLYYGRREINIGIFKEDNWYVLSSSVSSSSQLTTTVSTRIEREEGARESTESVLSQSRYYVVGSPFCWCYIDKIDLPLSENLLRQKKPLEMKSYYIIQKIKKQNGELLNSSSYCIDSYYNTIYNTSYNTSRQWGRMEEAAKFNSKEDSEDKIESLIRNKYIKDSSYVKILQVSTILIDVDNIDNKLEDTEEKKIDRFSLIDME